MTQTAFNLRPTSIDAWRKLFPSLPKRRREVLTAIIDNPGKTAAQLEALTGNRHLSKRTSELERQGLIVGLRQSDALHWYPVESVPESVVDLQPRKRPCPHCGVEL